MRLTGVTTCSTRAYLFVLQQKPSTGQFISAKTLEKCFIEHLKSFPVVANQTKGKPSNYANMWFYLRNKFKTICRQIIEKKQTDEEKGKVYLDIQSHTLNCSKCFTLHPLLLISTPTQLLWDAFCHFTNAARKPLIHIRPLMSIARDSFIQTNETSEHVTYGDNIITQPQRWIEPAPSIERPVLPC